MNSRFLVGILAASLHATQVETRLSGRVLDENNAAVPGAQVSLCAAGSGSDAPRQLALADPGGNFSFRVAAPGDYLVSVERQGFFRLRDRPVQLSAGANEITLILNTTREVFESVDVAYSPPTIDFDRATPEERVTGTQLLEIPYPSTNSLRNALRVVPGISQDSRGGIHYNGGTEEQVLYTLDGFQINDPLSGRFDSRVSVEAVRTIEASPLTPAEFGKGSAGALAIKTSTGDDRFRYTGTNFVPSVEHRKGFFIGGWTPRFGFSGPIRKGRAWFSDNLDLQYDKRVIEELPKGEDRATSWRATNLLRNQFNVTPANIIYTGFLASFWTAPRTGLSVLDPLETTIDRRARQWFFNIKDQWYFSRGALLEAGVAVNRTFGREIPQGTGILVYTPDGRRGNSYWDATRTASRDQFLANAFLPSFTLFGGHQVKTGIDLDAGRYWQDVGRTGYEFVREDFTLSRRVLFAGNGRLRLSNTEASWYLQDSWKALPSLLVEIGARVDWDRIVGNTNLAPRVGVSWAPPGLDHTKISGGYGVVHDQTSLRLFSRPLDQYSLTTHFRNDGRVLYGPALTVFRIGDGPLKTPRYRIWNLAAEHRLFPDLFARVRYARRRGGRGLTYVNSLDPGAGPEPGVASSYGSELFDAIYHLSNMRRDVFDSVEITVRQVFRKQYEWLASYTRSRALSNAVVDLTADEPLLATRNAGPMPWDAPNRLVSWGYLPTCRKNWALAYLLETRTGYPFSVHDERGLIQGAVNSFRFPAFFELNLFLERRFVFRKHRWAFRFGFNNITGHENPNVVNADTSSSRFMTFYGGQSRAMNFRIRWLGRD